MHGELPDSRMFYCQYASYSPPGNDIIKNLEVLSTHDYILRAANSAAKDSNSPWMEKRIYLFSTLIRKLHKKFTGAKLSDDFLKRFKFSDNLFGIQFWASALSTADDCGYLIKAHGKDREQKERKCQFCQKLAVFTHNFFGFLPPNNEELFRSFRKIQEAGIADRFTKENYGMVTSSRVQDRVRVTSKTQVKIVREEIVVVVSATKGEIVTVFLLWILCIIRT